MLEALLFRSYYLKIQRAQERKRGARNFPNDWIILGEYRGGKLIYLDNGDIQCSLFNMLGLHICIG